MLNIYNLKDSLQNELVAIQQTTWINLNDTNASQDDLRQLLAYNNQLWQLNLYCGSLTKLPDLSHCIKLENLNIRNNMEMELPRNYLPPNVKKLNISRAISEIPDQVWSLPKLEEVTITTHTLKAVSIPANANIKKLKINATNLNSLTFASPQPNLNTLEVYVYKGLEEIDISWGNCTELKYLKVNASSCTQVNCNFTQLHKIKSVEFQNCNITDYTFLQSLSTELYRLDVNQTTPWSGFPKKWKWYKNMWWLSLQSCTDTYFPKLDNNITRLDRLYITNNKFKNIIEAVKNSKSVKELHFNNPAPTDLDVLFKAIPQVTRLFLSTPDFTNIQLNDDANYDIVSLQLAGGGKIENLDFLDKMPQLKYFSLEDCQLSSPKVLLRQKTVPIQSLKRNLPDLKFKNDKQFCGLCSAIARSSMTQADKEFYVEYFSKKRSIEINKKWDWNRLYDLAAVYHPTLKKKVLSALDRKITEQYTDKLWTGNEVVYIAGNPKKEGAEIKRRLAAFNMSIEKEFIAKVTHVLLCVGSVEVDKIKERTFIPFTLTQLRERAAQEKEQFLVKNAKAAGGAILVERLGQLLTSNDLATVQVGLEMIEQGGLPAAAFSDLLILQKTTADNKIRKAVTQTLETFAPREWLDVVRDGLSFKAVYSKKSEDEIRRQFRKLARRTSPQLMQQLSRWLYEKTGRGLSYALKTNAKAAVKQQAYDLIFKDGYLDFAKGLGQTANYEEDIAHYYQRHSSAPKLPVAALKNRTITGLNLWRLNYQQLEDKIAEFKDLEELNLAHNYLEELPVAFAALTKLKELDLSHNQFKTFPTVLQQLPNLRKIDLRKNENNYKPQRLEVPKVFTDLRPNCQVLT